MMDLEKDLNKLKLEELYQELGMSIYIASDMSRFLEKLQTYQHELMKKIEEIMTNEQQ